MSPRIIESHTGLRGIAALLVVGYHLQFGGGYHLPFEDATAFFERGYLWVDLFFILSGFIISYTAGGDRSQAFTHNETKRFLIARIARVYPLHLFCLGYLVLFSVAQSLIVPLLGAQPPTIWTSENLVRLVRQLLLLDAWGIGPSIGWNIPSWSISAELFAYLAFPLLVTLHVWRPRSARLGFLLVAIGFYAGVAATTGDLDITSGLAPLRCLAGFMLGMLLFYHRDRFLALPDSWLTLLQAASLLLVLAGLMNRWNDVVLIPPFVALVGTSWPDRGLVARLLSLRPIQFLGEISYSVYLNHVCLLQILWFLWARLDKRIDLGLSDAVGRSLWIALAVAVVLLVSTLTYRYVERPAREYLIRRLLHRRPRVPTRVPTSP